MDFFKIPPTARNDKNEKYKFLTCPTILLNPFETFIDLITFLIYPLNAVFALFMPFEKLLNILADAVLATLDKAFFSPLNFVVIPDTLFVVADGILFPSAAFNFFCAFSMEYPLNFCAFPVLADFACMFWIILISS